MIDVEDGDEAIDTGESSTLRPNNVSHILVLDGEFWGVGLRGSAYKTPDAKKKAITSLLVSDVRILDTSRSGKHRMIKSVRMSGRPLP